MAKFCIHCGKKLEEGQICDCQKNQTTSNQTSDLINKLLDVFKGMFVQPMDTLKKYTTNKEFNLGIILVGIFAIATSILSLSIVKNAYSLIIGGVGYTASSFGYGFGNLNVPYLKIFFTTLVVTIALVFIYTGLLYLTNTIIFKGDKDYKKTFNLYAINSALMSTVLLIAAIFMFVHVNLGMTILLAGLILNLVYQIKGLKLLGVKDENKHGYIYLITTILNCLVLFIIMKIFS
ncbi:MAG: YIP1 family protein [Bacilli bacterium]|nr:YIP1 family protein [Bacilli bacterium]